MSTILYVFVAILVLAIMIFIHELGHYTAGRLLGFKILDFSIGFGPAIFKFKKKDITYALRAVPLGGACRFYGEDDEPMDAVAFNSQEVWKRIIVVFAGPLMNILFAYVLAVIMMFTYGYDDIRTYDNGAYAVTISGFSDSNGPAKKSGLKKGDVILAVDGEDVSAGNEEFDARCERCSQLIANAAPEGVAMTVMRGDKQLDVYVRDIYNSKEGRNIIGVFMGASVKPYGFFESFGKAFDFLASIVKTTFTAIGGWFKHGIQAGEISGVVGTVAVTAQMASYGFENLLLVTILISISLGLFNLFPLPALDGGRLVFLLIELIFRKPVPRNIEATVHAVGMFLLFGLMALVTVFDVLGLFNGNLILK